jgi:hypothetical protein
VRLGTPAVVRLEGPLAHGKTPSMSVVAEVQGPERLARSTTWRPLGTALRYRTCTEAGQVPWRDAKTPTVGCVTHFDV